MTTPTTPHHAYVVEVDDTTIGIVVRDDGGIFRFYAATRAFEALDQQRFASPRAAQRAARMLSRRRGSLGRAA